MFILSPTSLKNINLRDELICDEAGAVCVFEGLVRNHNNAKKVLKLDYEAEESLCLKEAQKIFEEVKARYNIHKIKCYHRVGTLSIGETAVWIGVSASHRDAAFKACRYIIEMLKKRLPIWKKEFYEEGHSDWISKE